MKNLLSFMICLVFLAASCKKDTVDASQSQLELSTDSIYFDTLFTNTASITHSLKIFNRSGERVFIDNISLGAGANSYFSFNAGGFRGPEVSGIELNPRDSIYVFVSVNIRSTDEDLPFIIEDRLQVLFNNEQHTVKLSAWGQNANVIRSTIINHDTSWSSEKPILVLGGVLVAENVKLTIEKGARIYLHADAPFIVDGSLIALGEHFDSTRITFKGDRLDRYYRDLPGSWPGIYFTSKSSGNLLRQVVVANAYQGIVNEGSQSTGLKLTLEECVVENCYDAGILSINSSIRAENCLVANSGKNIVLAKGGEYEFLHCTSVAISNRYIIHEQPALTVTDFVKRGETYEFADLNAMFTNCIFWGTDNIVEDEVVVLKEGAGVFDVRFASCIWRVKAEPENVTYSKVTNVDPLFRVIDPFADQYDFRLAEGSPAIDSGVDTGLENDLDGRSRAGNPDIGAYESAF